MFGLFLVSALSIFGVGNQANICVEEQLNVKECVSVYAEADYTVLKEKK